MRKQKEKQERELPDKIDDITMKECTLPTEFNNEP